MSYEWGENDELTDRPCQQWMLTNDIYFSRDNRFHILQFLAKKIISKRKKKDRPLCVQHNRKDLLLDTFEVYA